jgi:hypothetical protein
MIQLGITRILSDRQETEQVVKRLLGEIPDLFTTDNERKAGGFSSLSDSGTYRNSYLGLTRDQAPSR